MVTVERLGMRFGNLTVFDNLTFSVQDGEFVSILGPSGCGKSTLLLCIAGLVKPTAGEITFRGQPVTGPSIERGVVFQEYALFPWKTVFGNVEFGLQMLRSRSEREREARVRELLALVGLTDFAHYYPYQLSGGMRQRVAIARSLAVNPSILLMDEPFGALDALTRRTLQYELIRIWELTKMTIIFVTHNFQEALFLSDRIVSLTRRPATLKKEFRIGVARPRNVENPDAPLSRLIAEVQDALYSEVEGLQETGH